MKLALLALAALATITLHGCAGGQPTPAGSAALARLEARALAIAEARANAELDKLTGLTK